MKKRESQPITKHTLNLFAGQVDKLQQLHPRLGAAKVIRELIENHIRSIEGRAADAIPAPEPTIQIEDILP